MNASEHLEPWVRPSNYAGFSPDGDFMILSRHRDSDIASESNWAVACKLLNAEDYHQEPRPTVYTWSANHWAVGWCEYLMVRADAPESVLTEAGEIVCSLAAYSILDETDFSEREWDAACETWQNSSIAQRVRYLNLLDMCIFASRRDGMPEDDNGHLRELLLRN